MEKIEDVIRRFKETGLKITPQRLSIFKYLLDNQTHPSAEDVYHEILKIHPSISFTTVYKTLQTLRNLGELSEININPERSHYDPVTTEHAHTFCRSCRQIKDLTGSPEGPLVLELPSAPEGFEILSVQVHAVGLCGECG